MAEQVDTGPASGATRPTEPVRRKQSAGSQRARPAPRRRGGDVPQLATGVDLIGEYEASGYKEAPCLVRRQDGQTIQLTPLLYRRSS